MKALAWLNIAVQTAFPLAVAFTPAVAGAKSQGHPFVNTEKFPLQTQIYTLASGETIASVAAKYNMTPEALRKLNQFRTFAQGFDRLQAGDELDVPLSPLPEVQWHSAPGSSQPDADKRQEHKIADYASQAGRFLASNPNGDSAASVASGMASGAVGSEIQQWLSRLGTARVQLDTDKDLSLKNSQLDLLVPLYEQKDKLVFTQGSIHHTDDRTQANLGAGIRYFDDAWAFGANTFLDYDMSRNHARAGAGLEYWRDFLKLGVNGYQRLTGWKDSPDVTDHQERPANGWDVRAQAWLPALPQLGGKLTYEQYYGSDVALFGKENRQRDPHAFTAGISYTPVPLITLGAEQRHGKANENDTRLSIGLNYQPGVPWRQQIDPGAVAAMRSLAGSRYDLVERNNNIVLEYRKNEVIHLKMADLVAGYAGEQKSLGVSVNSKYGLARIDWAATDLIAAGGKILRNGDDWTVVLPAYRSAAQAVNTYTVSGVATDKKGNVSSQAQSQVTVTQAAIDAATSTLSPASAFLPANGASQQQFVLKVSDKEGNPVDLAETEISVEKSAKIRGTSNATVSSFTRRAAGEYVMTVTAGTMPEAFTLTPSARNTHFASTDVTLTADNTTALVDTLERVEDNAIADGKSQNSVRVTVVDAQNNRVPGQTVSLAADNNATITASATTDKDGVVVVPVTSVKAGKTTVSASINGKSGKDIALNFRPDPKTAHIAQKDLSVLPEISLADGKTEKTILARVSDAQDNPVPDVPVTLSADNGAILAEKTLTTDAQGVVATTLTSTVAGRSQVTARVNQSATSKDTTFTGNTATAIVTSVNTTETSGIADGTTAVKFRALIKDQNGNPLSGLPVDWKSDKDSSIVAFSATQTLTSDQGVAEIEITSTRAYNDVVVTASTNASSQSASPFVFVADRQNPVITALTSNKQTLTADGSDAANLSVSVTDNNGNPLSGISVTLSNNNNAAIAPAQPVTDASGQAFASLTSLHAGEVQVVASLKKGGEKTLSLQAIADERTAGVSVSAETTSATAGQEKPVTLTATVVDGNGNPVSGTSVAWQTDHNQLSANVSQTNARGEAVVQLTGTQAVVTTVTAVLYNGKKGSAPVTFGPGQPAQPQSQLTLTPQSITADGKSTALASLTLRDQWDNPVPGQTVNWSADEKSGIHFTATEKGNGLYQASVSGTAEGVWALNARTGNLSLETSLGLLASQDTALIDSVTVSGTDIAKADGVDTVTVRAQIKDMHGNTKLKGVAVGWDTSLGTLSSRLSSTDENGVAEIKLSSRTAGQAQVSAMLGGSTPVNADKPVSFTAGDINADTSSFTILPSSIVAGKERATLRVTARDAEGNLLSGLKDKVSPDFSPDLDMTVSSFSEASAGVYEATIAGKKTGTTQVSAGVNGTRINHTASLTLVADNDTAIVKGNISVTPSSAIVGDTVTYTAVLSDANGNALGAGIPVTWSANEGSTLSSQVTRTNDTGTASVTLTRKQTGTARVSLILPSGTTTAPDVVFSAGEMDEERSELTLSPSVIVAGKDTATLTLTLRDSNGNLLTGKTVNGLSDNSHVTIEESKQSSDAPGRYAMTISSNKAGTAILSAKVGDKTLSQTRTLTVRGDTESWKLTSVTADKSRLSADDTKGVTYSATVTDAHGNLLSGVVVAWQLSGQSVSYAPTSRTDSNGVATTTVISHTAGQLAMTAWLDDRNHL